METSVVIAAAVFALVSSITPGPNNLMLAASGLAYGFRRTLPLLAGVVAGFQALLLAVALGLGAVFERYPASHTLLRALGAAYLLHLAWKLWQASSAGTASLDKPLGFARGATFQAVNPKAWMMTVGAVSAYTLEGARYWLSVAVLAMLFLVIGSLAIACWAAFGAGFRTLLSDPRKARRVGRGMAVLTALSCVLVLI